MFEACCGRDSESGLQFFDKGICVQAVQQVDVAR